MFPIEPIDDDEYRIVYKPLLESYNSYDFHIMPHLMGTFLSICFFFFLLDTNQFKCIKRLGSQTYPTINDYVNIFPIVMFNLIVNCGITEFIIHKLDIMEIQIDWYYNIIGFIISLIVADVWFYIIHRLLHYIPALYKVLHMHHHIHTEPFAFTALDTHFIENLGGSVPSVMLGPLISYYFGYMDYIGTLLWSMCIIMNLGISHCGYAFAGDNHFIHHKYPGYNFGQGLMLCDRFFGTKKK
jgi:sterol desaturase/sphingolipid hydroxylase (fatty acid hydroxylase superfamily)